MKPDEIRREFRKLSEVRVSEGLVERARHGGRAPTPRRGNRPVTAIVALALFVPAAILAWSALRPSSEPTPATGQEPEVAILDCSGGRTEVVTPVVQVQPDGVHIEVRNLGNAAGIVIDQNSGTGELAAEVDPDDPSVVLGIHPGDHMVECWDGTWSERELRELRNPLQVVDPNGIWHDPALACPPEEVEVARFDGGEVSVNPPSLIDQVIRHAVPGIEATDIVDYTEYPAAEWGERWGYRVVREERTLARLWTWEGGPHRLIGIEACMESGIGDRERPSAGPLANPLSVPGFSRCDPYAQVCGSVWVSQAVYAELRGEPVPEPVSGYPSCEEVGPDEACAVHPDDNAWELLLTPDAVDAFAAEYGCGSSQEGVCRLRDV